LAQRDDINQDQKSAIFLHRVDDIEANSIVVFDTRILTASGKRAPTSWARRVALKGFTLTELIVALAIVAIITAFAIPAFSHELLGALQYARFAAIKNAQNVVVCPLKSGTTNQCSTSSAWNTGWLVFAPASASCSATGGATGDVVLKTQSGFGTTDTATFTAGSGGS
jgi:prepilin-type N-terminal cleavage/methylation domain-containing protein